MVTMVLFPLGLEVYYLWVIPFQPPSHSSISGLFPLQFSYDGHVTSLNLGVPFSHLIPEGSTGLGQYLGSDLKELMVMGHSTTEVSSTDHPTIAMAANTALYRYWSKGVIGYTPRTVLLDRNLSVSIWFQATPLHEGHMVRPLVFELVERTFGNKSIEVYRLGQSCDLLITSLANPVAHTLTSLGTHMYSTPGAEDGHGRHPSFDAAVML